ncbi:MAG: CE1 family esterase [Planctomycetota bacterium]
MKLTFYLAVASVLTIGIAEPAAAQTLRERLLERFDKDGDGKLSQAERRAGLEELRKRRNPDGREPETLTWTIDGLKREALIYLPKDGNEKPAPLVFGFHGHGGSMHNADRSFGLQNHWPQAIVVYMQGVPTPGRLTDPEGKRNGWQHDLGEQNDRDLKFFDAVLKSLREKYKIDDSRIYSTGHSNGGGFTYLLWAARGDVFAAIAPSAAGSRALRRNSPAPIPAMHIAGRNDNLVKYSWQQVTMATLRRNNGCNEEGSDWAIDCMLYKSEKNAPVVTMIHSGTHKYPPQAPPLIVKFFKEHHRSR